MSARAFTGNAGDAEQVKQAGTRADRRRARELEDLIALLDTPQGRRVLWRLLDHCGAFQSVFAETDARTNYNAGRQDVGHFLLAEIGEARVDAIVQLMTESRKDLE